MTNANFISLYRNAVKALLDARATLKSFREQDSAAKVETGTSIVESMVPGDFAGSNADLAQADLVAALATMDSLEASLTDFTKSPPVPTVGLASLLKFRQ